MRVRVQGVWPSERSARVAPFPVSGMCISELNGEHRSQEAAPPPRPTIGSRDFRGALDFRGAPVFLVRWDVEQVVVRPDGQFSHHR